MENCGSKRNKGHTNEVNNPLSSFPFSFFFFFIFFHSECSCGNQCLITAPLTVNSILAHVLDNKLLYSSKRSSFALDSTCAYCYWPGTGGCYFPIVKLQDETNMADSHNKTDLVRSITHHHSLSYNCIFRGVGVVFFSTPRITQSHFPLNTSFPRRLSQAKFWPTYRSLQHTKF